jgi:multiple sugar transport system substrate-binding protein
MSHSSSRSSLSRRGFLSAGLASVAAVGLAACGGQSAQTGTTGSASGKGGAEYTGPKVALTFWNGFTGGDGAFMKKLITDFQSSHSNITVTMQTMQWADFYKKLPTAVTADKAPDIAVMHLDSVATMAARRSIQPLDDVAKALGLQESDFAPVPWKAGTTRTSATPSRSTSTRWASSTTRPSWRRPAWTPTSPRSPPRTTSPPSTP